MTQSGNRPRKECSIDITRFEPCGADHFTPLLNTRSHYLPEFGRRAVEGFAGFDGVPLFSRSAVWPIRGIAVVAKSPHVMLGAPAFCVDLAAASLDYANGYPRSAGGVAISLARPNVVLVAQAVLGGLASATFDAARQHYPWSVGSISIVAASPLVMLGTQAFCVNLAAASFDYAYGCPRSVGGIAIVAASPLVVLGAQTFTGRPYRYSICASSRRRRRRRVIDCGLKSLCSRRNHIHKASTHLHACCGRVSVLAQRDGRIVALPDYAIWSSVS
jgi:hypothetical protein